MGDANARYSADVGAVADQAAADLAPLGAVTWKKMFGGAGIFLDGTMFALVDSAARLHFKAGEADRARYLEAGAEQHPRMPYYTVPDAVLAEPKQLLDWARAALAA